MNNTDQALYETCEELDNVPHVHTMYDLFHVEMIDLAGSTISELFFKNWSDAEVYYDTLLLTAKTSYCDRYGVLLNSRFYVILWGKFIGKHSDCERSWERMQTTEPWRN